VEEVSFTDASLGFMSKLKISGRRDKEGYEKGCCDTVSSKE
jgi:hypothetical protein